MGMYGDAWEVGVGGIYECNNQQKIVKKIISRINISVGLLFFCLF